MIKSKMFEVCKKFGVCPKCSYMNTIGDRGDGKVFCEACTWVGLPKDLLFDYTIINDYHTDIQRYQDRIGKWSKENFNKESSTEKLLGIVEEVGELAHAILKQKQHIRMTENHDANIKDAIGDIFFFLADLCNCRDLNLDEIVQDTINKVVKRNWTKDIK